MNNHEPSNQQPQIGDLLKSLGLALFQGSKNSAKKGFLGSLFDFSFSSFITTKLVKVLYGIFMLAMLGGVIYSVVKWFEDSVESGFIALFTAPLTGFVFLAIFRVVLESVIVIFRITETLQSIDSKQKTVESTQSGLVATSKRSIL